MKLSKIGDRSTSAARPHDIQSSVDDAANGTLLSTTHCSKRKIADCKQDFLPIGKRLHSRSIRSLPSAYNDPRGGNFCFKTGGVFYLLLHQNDAKQLTKMFHT
jgi:hypothetical protein